MNTQVLHASSNASASSYASDTDGGFFSYHGIWAPGVRLFRRLGFRVKAVIVSALLTWPLLLVVAWQSWHAYDSQMQFRRDEVKHQVDVALGVITHLHAQEAAGKIDRAQAQQMARETLRPLRYAGSEYFWVNDMNTRMVMHPTKPELEGQDVGAMKDPNGFALFQGFVRTVREHKAGYVAYQWPKPGKAEPVDKVSYVAGFEPWGWVVGTGVYVDDAKAAAMAQWRVQALLVVATALLGSYAFHCFYLVMMGGLRETERHLKAMTEGDLTTSPRPWGQDEAARLMHSVREMQGSLRSMVQRVREASGTIVQSSTEIANGASDLQARTEQSAASLEQSASAMEQISATVQTTAEHVQEVASLARGNAAVATRGGQVMSAMVQTMEEINAASAQINDIIGTIDGIAFQTNILALNAAVEAARAGEQGRGFAVVAGEVRSLAQRSAQAAREIKHLIGGTVEKVATGTGVVREAGGTIAEIVASAEKVDRLLGEIANGAREQSSGVTQIGHTVAELDKATQQNAALVEQTAAASTAMREQAHTLAEDVARFKLPGA